MHAFTQFKRSMMVLGIAVVPLAFAGTAHAQQPASRAKTATTAKTTTAKTATVTRPAAASKAVQQPVKQQVSKTKTTTKAATAVAAKPTVTKVAKADTKATTRHHRVRKAKKGKTMKSAKKDVKKAA